MTMFTGRIDPLAWLFALALFAINLGLVAGTMPLAGGVFALICGWLFARGPARLNRHELGLTSLFIAAGWLGGVCLFRSDPLAASLGWQFILVGLAFYLPARFCAVPLRKAA
jgi:1,4-dihydroxy-2-naphthoate octaprenyltransferase